MIAIKEVEVKGPIRLDQFLKWCRAVNSGGESKFVIKSGMVFVNGLVTLSRGKKIFSGDVIDVKGIGKYKALVSAGEILNESVTADRREL